MFSSLCLFNNSVYFKKFVIVLTFLSKDLLSEYSVDVRFCFMCTIVTHSCFSVKLLI